MNNKLGLLPELYYANDRRCYNGAMCSDLQKEIGSKEVIFNEIKKSYPNYSCTYFPLEGKYLSFLKHKQLTGNMFEDKGQCLLEAWRVLIKKDDKSKAIILLECSNSQKKRVSILITKYVVIYTTNKTRLQFLR